MFLRTDESGFLWISLLQYLFIELEDVLGAKDGRNSTTDEDKVMKFSGLISKYTKLTVAAGKSQREKTRDWLTVKPRLLTETPCPPLRSVWQWPYACRTLTRSPFTTVMLLSNRECYKTSVGTPVSSLRVWSVLQPASTTHDASPHDGFAFGDGHSLQQ